MGIKDVISPFTAWKNIAMTPVTIKDPINDKLGAPRYRGFHKNDLEKCIGCGTCEEICQNAAIDMVPVEGIEANNGDSGLRPMLDYGRCCWCGLCVDVCATSSLNLSNEFIWIESDPEKFRFVPGAEKKYWDNSELGYTRAENYNLIDLERVHMEELHAEERGDSFIEFVKGFSTEQAKKEAERCVQCGICVAACPAHMDIPGYIAEIRNDDIEAAMRVLYGTNPLPEACGRICTHRCESVCALSHRGEAVSIRWLKRYIADQIPAEDYKRVLGTDFIEKVDKNIGIVGAGPAGLTTAYYLALLGYSITIYEEQPEAGGMMRYGIPSYRLPYDQIDKDVNYITSLGVEFKYNTKIGVDISLEDLQKQHDAVFVGVGLSLGRSTGAEGADHKDVHMAADLLREIALGNEIPVERDVVVVGGGNVAMDIARSMARLQMKKYGKVGVIVTSLEDYDNMPADREEIVEGEEEGIIFRAGRGPRKFVSEDGVLKGVESIKVLSIFDEEGRFNPQYDENDITLLKGDLIVEAIGQAPDMKFLSEPMSKEIEWNGRRIKVFDGQMTNVDGLFIGGDLVQGPDVVTSINNGHKAAVAIDEFLHGKK